VYSTAKSTPRNVSSKCLTATRRMLPTPASRSVRRTPRT